MAARMQPMGVLWARMPRVVRDLAAACGRQVRLEVSGGDTELDRALLEAVKDPLMHLVRNAVDHGIEDVHTRVAAGKPTEGVLTIRAYHSGGRVVVEVQDDGKGIDTPRIGSHGCRPRPPHTRPGRRVGRDDLLQLLFLPGFSMAEAVTNVSGRGVGLDVVHTKIRAIGGTVEVESRLGRGTATWRLRIPLTLAIISAIIVESAGSALRDTCGQRAGVPSRPVWSRPAPRSVSTWASVPIPCAGRGSLLRWSDCATYSGWLRDKGQAHEGRCPSSARPAEADTTAVSA